MAIRLEGKILITLWVATANLPATPTSVTPDPRPTIEAFCKAEFEGNEEAYTMVELSKGRQKDIKRHYNVSTLRLGDMIAGSYTCDPAWIISSYRIMGLNAKENTVTATVEYEVLGKFGKRSETGCATEFIAQDVKLLKEQLKFHYSTGKNGMKWVRGTAW